MKEHQHDKSQLLRQQAEQLLCTGQVHLPDLPLEDVPQLVHELSVHHAELELQNETLRQSQQELQETRSKYQDLYDFAPVGYFTLDEKGSVCEANLAGAALLGIAREFLIRRAFIDFVTWEDRDRYYLHHRRLTNTQLPQTCELRIQRADKTLFQARLESAVVANDTQTQGVYRTVVIDITEQVRAEQALQRANEELERRVQERTADLVAANQALQAEIAERQQVEAALRASEARFQLVLQGSPTTVFTQDRDLRYTWIYNPMSMLPHSQILGKTDAELLSSDEAQSVTAITQEVVQTGVGKRDEVQVTIDQHTRWYDIKVEPLHDAMGAIEGITCVATDITEYHHAQERQRLLAEVSTLLAQSLDPTTRLQDLGRWVVSRLADVCMINNIRVDDSMIAPLVIAYSTADQIHAYTISQEYPIDPGSHSPITQVVRSGEMIHLSELSDDQVHSWKVPAEHLTYLRGLDLSSYIGVPLRARGRIIGVLSLMASSDRRYNPKDMALVAELASRVALSIDNARLYEAERQARIQAEATIRMRDQIFRVISHDLKSPLMTILGYTHLFEKRIREMHLPDTAWFVQRLSRQEAATQQIVAQVREMADTAALQAGKELALHKDVLNLETIIWRMTETYQQTSERHIIRTELPATALCSIGDEDHLVRAFDNFFTNAIKYSPDGGEVRITLTQVDRDGRAWAVLTVQDQGIGIPANDLPFIFEPFHRASNVAETTDGSGLGLANARQIIEQHGGRISVASEEGSGTTFTIWLPLSTA